MWNNLQNTVITERSKMQNDMYKQYVATVKKKKDAYTYTRYTCSGSVYLRKVTAVASR